MRAHGRLTASQTSALHCKKSVASMPSREPDGEVKSDHVTPNISKVAGRVASRQDCARDNQSWGTIDLRATGPAVMGTNHAVSHYPKETRLRPGRVAYSCHEPSKHVKSYELKYVAHRMVLKIFELDVAHLLTLVFSSARLRPRIVRRCSIFGSRRDMSIHLHLIHPLTRKSLVTSWLQNTGLHPTLKAHGEKSLEEESLALPVKAGVEGRIFVVGTLASCW